MPQSNSLRTVAAAAWLITNYGLPDCFCMFCLHVKKEQFSTSADLREWWNITNLSMTDIVIGHLYCSTNRTQWSEEISALTFMMLKVIANQDNISQQNNAQRSRWVMGVARQQNLGRLWFIGVLHWNWLYFPNVLGFYKRASLILVALNP